MQRDRRVSREEALLTVRMWTRKECKRAYKEMREGLKVSSQLSGPRRVQSNTQAQLKRAYRASLRAQGLCVECREETKASRCRKCALKRKA